MNRALRFTLLGFAVVFVLVSAGCGDGKAQSTGEVRQLARVQACLQLDGYRALDHTEYPLMPTTVNVLGINVPWLQRMPWVALWVPFDYRDSSGNTIGGGVNVTFFETVAEARAWASAIRPQARRIGTATYSGTERNRRLHEDIATCIRSS